MHQNASMIFWRSREHHVCVASCTIREEKSDVARIITLSLYLFLWDERWSYIVSIECVFVLSDWIAYFIAPFIRSKFVTNFYLNFMKQAAFCQADKRTPMDDVMHFLTSTEIQVISRTIWKAQLAFGYFKFSFCYQKLHHRTQQVVCCEL